MKAYYFLSLCALLLSSCAKDVVAPLQQTERATSAIEVKSWPENENSYYKEYNVKTVDDLLFHTQDHFERINALDAFWLAKPDQKGILIIDESKLVYDWHYAPSETRSNRLPDKQIISIVSFPNGNTQELRLLYNSVDQKPVVLQVEVGTLGQVIHDGLLTRIFDDLGGPSTLTKKEYFDSVVGCVKTGGGDDAVKKCVGGVNNKLGEDCANFNNATHCWYN